MDYRITTWIDAIGQMAQRIADRAARTVDCRRQAAIHSLAWSAPTTTDARVYRACRQVGMSHVKACLLLESDPAIMLPID